MISRSPCLGPEVSAPTCASGLRPLAAGIKRPCAGKPSLAPRLPAPSGSSRTKFRAAVPARRHFEALPRPRPHNRRGRAFVCGQDERKSQWIRRILPMGSLVTARFPPAPAIPRSILSIPQVLIPLEWRDESTVRGRDARSRSTDDGAVRHSRSPFDGERGRASR